MVVAHRSRWIMRIDEIKSAGPGVNPCAQSGKIIFVVCVQRNRNADSPDMRGGIDQGKVSRRGVEKLATGTALAAKIETECCEDLSENNLLRGDAFVNCDLFGQFFRSIGIGIPRDARELTLDRRPDLWRRAIGILIQGQVYGVSLRRERHGQQVARKHAECKG